MTIQFKHPRCPHCGEKASLVTGAEIYPGRTDLGTKKFWQCADCDTFVGCHEPGAFTIDATGKRIVSDGTLPLGTLADEELRGLRMQAHQAIDPLWRGHPDKDRRRKTYSWLAQKLGAPLHDCHVGLFDADQCGTVVNLLASREPSDKEIDQAHAAATAGSKPAGALAAALAGLKLKA